MPEIFVKSFTHLKDRPKADHALRTLQRIASLVKPIMRKHGWVLPVLSEFFPENPSLLDINAGQKILIRLRPPHAPDTFYDEQDVMGTMLHELTHNVHGPHDEKFYKFLSGLEDEYDALRRSGYAGEGFHSEGKRIGANVSHDLPPHLARQKAAEAAEKRKTISVALQGGGRLGGFTRANKSPRELAAEAAERRARDEKSCASGAVAQREAEKAANESVQSDVIDLTLDSDSEPEPEIIIIDESSSPPSPRPFATGTQSPNSINGLYSSSSSTSLSSASSSALPRPSSSSALSASASTPALTMSGATTPSSSTSGTTPTTRPSRPQVHRVPRGAGGATPTLPKLRSVSRPASRPRTRPPTPPPTRAGSLRAGPYAPPPHAALPAQAEWTCPRCTLVNDALALQCAVCAGVRPGLQQDKTPSVRRSHPLSQAGWTCGVCGEGDMPHDFWTCRFCGSIKASS